MSTAKSTPTRRPWSWLAGIDAALMNAIATLNFPLMTPVQTATIPLFLQLKDVAAEAVTGSGKTLAFLVPLLETLQRRGRTQPWTTYEVGAIVISPTRELASQTYSVLLSLLHPHLAHLSAMLAIGGTSVDEDVHTFRATGAHIIVATPGRLEDLLARKMDLNLSVAVKSVEFLVLDEADRLLDLGFHATLNTILAYLPRQRRTGLFSATQTQQVAALARAGLRNPVAVSVTETTQHRTPLRLDNHYVLVGADGNKLRAILHFIATHSVRKAIIFVPTCACVDYWRRVLPQLDAIRRHRQLRVFAVHGRMRGKRAHVALDAFRRADDALLLATDVVARGIDIPDVDWVLQWDPPANATAFVHRVGRTARSGASGAAVVFLLDTESSYVTFIERNQDVRLSPIPDSDDDAAGAQLLLAALRKLQMDDRAVMDAATTAFVSHVRAYSKYECALLLRVKDLPLVQMALTYGLLQLPRMPEMKNVNTASFPLVPDVDIATVAYKDKQRERARLLKLEAYRATGVWPGHKRRKCTTTTVAWSRTKEANAERKEKRTKRKLGKQQQIAFGTNRKKRKANRITEEEYAELVKDVALIKKLKRKKITEEDFERAIGIEL